MVRRIEGTIDYEKHNEVLNDNHKVLIYLDDMTLTGKSKHNMIFPIKLYF